MWNKWSLRARGGGMSLTYAIADLHGRFDLLTAAFDAIVKHAAERSFKIITLGGFVCLPLNELGRHELSTMPNSNRSG